MKCAVEKEESSNVDNVDNVESKMQMIIGNLKNNDFGRRT